MIQRDVQRYGDVVRYRLGRTVAHVIRHPDDVRHVLQDNHANYVKGRGQERVRVILGNGLITSEGAFWRRQRKLAQPAFHSKRLQSLVTTMAAVVLPRLDLWSAHATSGRPFDLADEMLRLTLAVVSRSLFGTDLTTDADALARAATLALNYATSQRIPIVDVPLSVPTPKNVRLRAAIRDVDRIVLGIIEGRRRAGVDTGDLLSMLLLARDDATGETMSDAQIRDEVVTLIGAGYETVANALAWTFILLSQHPDVWRKLREEVLRVVGGRVPTFQDLAELRYVRMVAEESLRLYPPVWMFGRRALADDDVHGYRIPAGSLVGISPYLIHRHPEFWAAPEAFDPERFDPALATKRHKYAYVPFGAGPRTCIGNGFAVMEMQLIIAMVTQRHRLALVPGPPIVPEPLFTLRPMGGVQMRIEPVTP